jgi:hypothetical protein
MRPARHSDWNASIRDFARWWFGITPQEQTMVDTSQIREHMEVIGADGVHLGTVDKVEGNRIKLTKADSGAQMEAAEAQGGQHAGHHHVISTGLVAGIEGNQVRLSATAANAVTFEEEEGGQQ